MTDTIQTKEAARQILANVSDIHAVLSVGGSHQLSLKLAAIREKAAFIFEGPDGIDTIVARYNVEAHDALQLLGEEMAESHGGRLQLNDAELIKISRLAEVFCSRVNVYFNRKSRAIMEGSDVD